METGTIFLRLLIVFVLSFVFGYERQKAHKHVGFGTFTFVAIGSCAIALVAMTIPSDNPLPLLGAVITGIGFLGAGALIKNNDKIFGFTSAASIWVFAILGVAFGVGDYLIGCLLYVFIWIVVMYDQYMERKGIGSYRRRLKIVAKKIVSEEEVRSFLKDSGIRRTKLISIEINKKEKKSSFEYFVEGDSEKIKKIPQEVMKVNWLESFDLE